MSPAPPRPAEYVAIGPRFSNNVLQTLLVLLNKMPKHVCHPPPPLPSPPPPPPTPHPLMLTPGDNVYLSSNGGC
jgi:hypothetical protein